LEPNARGEQNGNGVSLKDAVSPDGSGIRGDGRRETSRLQGGNTHLAARTEKKKGVKSFSQCAGWLLKPTEREKNMNHQT
jgi:hypothetical protein